MSKKLSDFIKWMPIKTSIQLRHETKPATKVNYPRKAIYACHLGENIGFEKGGLDSRPVLIVSSDNMNKHSGNVIVIPMSKNIKYKPGTKQLYYNHHYVLYKSKYKKLNFDSVIQPEDMRVVSKDRLGNFIGFIDNTDMKKIETRMKDILQL